MTEHLSNQILESYRRGAVPVADLPLADEHLAVCAQCRQKLGETQALSNLTGFFRRDAELLATHLDYEQLESYVQGRLAPEEKKTVESHLRDCSSCQSEAEDLRAFAVQFDSQPVTRLAPVERQSFWQKLSKPAWLKKTFAGLSPFTWQMAGAAAVVALLALTIILLLRKPPQNNNLTIKTTPSPVIPAPQPITPAPVSPDESLPPQVDLALRNERLELPAEIAEMVGRKGEARGGTEKGDTFSLTAPVATFINTGKPTLRWQPLVGATSYNVKVFNADFDEVASASNLNSTQWTTDKPLRRGAQYSWQVTAHKDGGEPATAPPAKFRVLGKSKADELALANQKYGANHLAMGALYAQAGLLDDAEREFNAELKANPQSAKARRLLQNLRAQRQPR